MKGKVVMKKAVIVIMIILIIIGGVFIAQKIKEENESWKVEITNDFINVRSDHSRYESKLDTVNKGETYKVIDIYLKDNEFVWYKIKIRGKKGWISSDRNNPYVKEINNPNGKGKEDYTVDYKAPIVKYYDETYKTESIDTIDTSHLEIEEDSDYDIKYQVYKEEEPEDRPGPQYWIQYTVTDSFENKTVKLQRIEFEITPADDKVLNFEDLR